MGGKRVDSVARVCRVRVVDDWEALLVSVEGSPAQFTGTCRMGEYNGTATVATADIDDGVFDCPATVVLNGKTETAADRKKEVCERALEAMETVVRDGGRVVRGGGEWQTTVGSTLADRFNGRGEINRGARAFADALIRMGNASRGTGGERDGEIVEGLRSRVVGIQAAAEICGICAGMGGAAVLT